MSQLEQLNQMAITLKSLHVPGQPLVLANVHDGATAQIVGSLSYCHALATASFSIAASLGIEDAELDLPELLAATRVVGSIAAKLGKPLTADLQDGYGERLEDAVSSVIDAGAVGINLEDTDKDAQRLMSPAVAAARVKKALEVAAQKGVTDFVVNARCDALIQGHGLDEVIKRGKLYLEAGATCVFVWGGAKRGGMTRDEVVKLSQAFDGRLNVHMVLLQGDGLTRSELAEIGVCRISLGPKIFKVAMEAYKKEAQSILG